MSSISHPLPSRLWVVRLSERLSSCIKREIGKWPSVDRLVLGDQLSRSVDSIGANIAEGYVRMRVRERLHFYSIAQGSLEETRFHVGRARDAGLVSPLNASVYFDLLTKLGEALTNLAKTTKDDNAQF